MIASRESPTIRTRPSAVARDEPERSERWLAGQAYFQSGFIEAEIVSFDDLMAAGSIAAARAAGKAGSTARSYVMRDSDVVEFRFNV